MNTIFYIYFWIRTNTAVCPNTAPLAVDTSQSISADVPTDSLVI